MKDKFTGNIRTHVYVSLASHDNVVRDGICDAQSLAKNYYKYSGFFKISSNVNFTV